MWQITHMRGRAFEFPNVGPAEDAIKAYLNRWGGSRDQFRIMRVTEEQFVQH